jgi:tetratricopeptide (TPR) repeat protein
VLLRESQVQPLLLLLEDLHWIDAETQTFLDALVGSLPTTRVLLLVNYRPDYQHTWGSKTYYLQLRIDPLPPANAEELLQALLGEDRTLEPLKRVLVERTEGNPFFLEESVQSLVETQVLVGQRGAYRMTRAPEQWQVPPTAQAVLAARIDRLSPGEKRLLQTAAVIGKDVPFALLQAIADEPEDSLRRELTRLQAAEFLYETSLFPDLEYTFKHALTHEVTYGGLLQERRRELHARIVGAIETLYQDRLGEHVERLAHHAMRGGVWDKAVRYARQAGGKAMASSANREAVVCFEHALASLQHLPDNQDRREQALVLRLELRNALFPLGEHERILAHLRQAETLAIGLDNRQRLGEIYTYMASGSWVMGDHEGSAAFSRKALRLATEGDVNLQVMANYRMGQAHYWLGDYRLAIDCLRRNVTILDGEMRYARFGMTGLPAVFSRSFLIRCLAESGEFVEAEGHGADAIRIAEAADHPFSLAHACGAVGRLHLRRGNLDDAMVVLDRGLDLCRTWSLPVLLNVFVPFLGLACALCGQVARALSLLEPLVAQHDSRGMGGWLSYSLLYLGDAYLLAERRAEARHCAERALGLSRERRERGLQADALRLLGDIATHQDPPETNQAGPYYQQALTLATELGMRPLVAHAHLGLGKLYRRTGQRDQGHEHLTTATTMYREMDMRFYLEQAETEMRESTE